MIGLILDRYYLVLSMISFILDHYYPVLSYLKSAKIATI
jgi:hypothetical protein